MSQICIWCNYAICNCVGVKAIHAFDSWDPANLWWALAVVMVLLVIVIFALVVVAIQQGKIIELLERGSND